MTRFEFRLQSVLGWRKLQMEAEEARLKQMLAEHALIEREAAALDAERASAELRLREQRAIPAPELWALADYREGARRRGEALAARLRACDNKIAAQRGQLAAARQRYRLLERLRDHRLAEWQYLENRERENFASDAYLARWKNSA